MIDCSGWTLMFVAILFNKIIFFFLKKKFYHSFMEALKFSFEYTWEVFLINEIFIYEYIFLMSFVLKSNQVVNIVYYYIRSTQVKVKCTTLCYQEQSIICKETCTTCGFWFWRIKKWIKGRRWEVADASWIPL